jgi:hypothetical protein
VLPSGSKDGRLASHTEDRGQRTKPQPKTPDRHTTRISIDTLRTHTARQSEAHTIATASQSCGGEGDGHHRYGEPELRG